MTLVSGPAAVAAMSVALLTTAVPDAMPKALAGIVCPFNDEQETCAFKLVGAETGDGAAAVPSSPPPQALRAATQAKRAASCPVRAMP